MLSVEIRVKGQLEAHWADWFGGLEIAPGEGETVLSGSLPDQQALHGILLALRDLALPLVSVEVGEASESL